MRGAIRTTAVSLWTALLVVSTVAKGASDAPTAFELVRSLEALQDQIVLGNQTALAARPKLMVLIAEKFAAAPVVAWRYPINIRAAVVYLLSGGQPKVIENLLAQNAFPGQSQKLVRGAIAFNEGRKDDARKLLFDIDARLASPSIGGYLAFAQSMLVPEQNPKRTMELLDTARLLSPGTLVEEAALRREIFLADELGDTKKFTILARQYIERFRSSLYAEDFRRRFAPAIIHIALSGDHEVASHLDEVLQVLGADDQRNISLMLARAAIIAGKDAVARFAMDRAERVTSRNGVEEARAALYRAAASIVSKDYGDGLALLKRVDRARLPAPDAQLYDAVLVVARQIGQWAEVTPEHSSSRAVPADRSAAAGLSSVNAAINLAEQSLANADRLMKEHSQ